MSMTREESMLASRLVDLSKQAYHKGIVTFSNFLNLNEQNIFHTCIPSLYGGYHIWGGYQYAERQIIAFLPDALLLRPEYPIVCLKIEPLHHKFAESLSHRDVLGSLMSLGIERGTTGDILVKDNRIYIFCIRKISAFIMEELTRIRHTAVRIEVADITEPEFGPVLKHMEGTVTSNRLDALLAAMCRISRSQAVELISRGNVFINGKQAVSASGSLSPEEIISVRGVGRFRFEEQTGETRKGRMRISYSKYI